MDVGFNLTIDLNGHVLTIPKSICVNSGAHLTIIDSNPSAEHKFTPNADGFGCWMKPMVRRPSPAASSPAVRAIRFRSAAAK